MVVVVVLKKGRLGYVFGAAVQRDEPSTARHVCFIAELDLLVRGRDL